MLNTAKISSKFLPDFVPVYQIRNFAENSSFFNISPYGKLEEFINFFNNFNTTFAEEFSKFHSHFFSISPGGNDVTPLVRAHLKDGLFPNLVTVYVSNPWCDSHPETLSHDFLGPVSKEFIFKDLQWVGFTHEWV